MTDAVGIQHMEDRHSVKVHAHVVCIIAVSPSISIHHQYRDIVFRSPFVSIWRIEDTLLSSHIQIPTCFSMLRDFAEARERGAYVPHQSYGRL